MAKEMLRDPEWQLVRELSEWQPDGGVLSVYFEIDPADRGEGWRIALKDELAEVSDAVARRVHERFPDGRRPPSGRTQIGFLECEGEREIWSAAQWGLGTVTAVEGERPFLTPLVKLLDEASPVGVVAVSLERVRVFDWSLGWIEELDGWELEIPTLDWRERKAPQRVAAEGTGASAAGRDQYGERLDHNRARFLKQAGELIAQRHGERPWRRILLIGDGDRPSLLAKGLGPKSELVHVVHHDLISAPAAKIEARVEEEVEHLNRQREEQLIDYLREAIGATPGAAVGRDEVLKALEMAQVRHLIFDSEFDFEPIDGAPATERFISLAVSTRAEVTPVEGLAAASLRDHGGVAALLRFDLPG
jgi:hypothetical protein